jgi:hypothetical protein
MRPACTAVATSLPALDAQRGRDLRDADRCARVLGGLDGVEHAEGRVVDLRLAQGDERRRGRAPHRRPPRRPAPLPERGVITSEEVVTDLAGRGWTVLEDGRTR